MENVSLTQLNKVLPIYYKARKPLALWGKPSTGKTSILRQFAQQKAQDLKLKYSEDLFGKEYFTFKTIILSQMDSIDLRGVPYQKDGVTYFAPASSLPRDGQGILFLDEISNVDHTMIAPVQQLMLEGRIENLIIPDTYWRVCAGNRSEDFCQVNELSLAFLRRTAHFEVEPDLEEILRYFLENQRDPRVIGFLKNHPDNLFPKVWDEKLIDKKANPFPYTWECVGELIDGVKDIPTLQRITGSYVGAELAMEFGAYCKLAEKIDIWKVVEDPKKEIAKIVSMSDKASMLYAIISSLAAYWYKKEKKLTALKVVGISAVLPPEFATAFLKLILKKRINELTGKPEFDKLLVALGVYFDE